MRSESEVSSAIDAYGDTIRRICFLHLKNYSDVEDVFQEVFLKYVLHEQQFESDAHEKAWLIRVAINACKDVIKSFLRQKVTSIDALSFELHYTDQHNLEIIDAVIKLPQKYKNVVYLFYYEGYTALEIAGILNKNENTIYTWLSRARRELKKALGDEMFDE